MTNIITQIETDLGRAWGSIETTVEADATEIWTDFRVILTSLVPSQYAILKGLIVRALNDGLTGDFADLETAILNDAEAAEIQWLKNLGSTTLQAVIATVKAGNPVLPVLPVSAATAAATPTSAANAAVSH